MGSLIETSSHKIGLIAKLIQIDVIERGSVQSACALISWKRPAQSTDWRFYSRVEAPTMQEYTVCSLCCALGRAHWQNLSLISAISNNDSSQREEHCFFWRVMKHHASRTGVVFSLVSPASFSSFSSEVRFNLSEASGGRMRAQVRMSVTEYWLSSLMQLPW